MSSISPRPRVPGGETVNGDYMDNRIWLFSLLNAIFAQAQHCKQDDQVQVFYSMVPHIIPLFRAVGWYDFTGTNHRWIPRVTLFLSLLLILQSLFVISMHNTIIPATNSSNQSTDASKPLVDASKSLVDLLCQAFLELLFLSRYALKFETNQHRSYKPGITRVPKLLTDIQTKVLTKSFWKTCVGSSNAPFAKNLLALFVKMRDQCISNTDLHADSSEDLARCLNTSCIGSLQDYFDEEKISYSNAMIARLAFKRKLTDNSNNNNNNSNHPQAIELSDWSSTESSSSSESSSSESSTDVEIIDYKSKKKQKCPNHQS